LKENYAREVEPLHEGGDYHVHRVGTRGTLREAVLCISYYTILVFCNTIPHSIQFPTPKSRIPYASPHISHIDTNICWLNSNTRAKNEHIVDKVVNKCPYYSSSLSDGLAFTTNNRRSPPTCRSFTSSSPPLATRFDCPRTMGL